MKPIDLNLPPKFNKWRENQPEAILAAICSEERFKVIQAPPGTGKSAIYMGIASITGGRSLVLTQTKGLQAQLIRDFASMGLKEIKGQANYPCLYFEGQRKQLPGCDEGPCNAGVTCDLKLTDCHYYDAIRIAKNSEIVVTNYRYWMTIHRHAEPSSLGSFDTLILDEAHDAANTLADFVRIKIDKDDIETLLGVRLLRKADIDEWVEWAEANLPLCRRKLDIAKARVAHRGRGIPLVRKLADIEANLVDLYQAREWRRIDSPNPPAWVPGQSTDWIIESDIRGTVFQPVWAIGYAEKYLFSGIKSVILTSATITERDAKYLGIGSSTFLEYPSPFKKKVRPVYSIPAARVRYDISPGEERIWLRRMDQIIEKEKGNNGIIHTVSYARAKIIVAKSKNRRLMLTHRGGDGGRSLRQAVAEFKHFLEPVILVSPSVGTGFDFPGDECRFQIISKIPFIDRRPEIIQARHKSDKRYLDHVAVVSLIQMVGRGVRSESDYCRCWIVDDNWGWFWSKNKKLFPKWFRTAVKSIKSLGDA
jgi:ATP-dependent DNA helicase DinG